MTLLDFERSNISEAVRIRRYIRRLVQDATSGPASAYARRVGTLRHEVADRYIETEVCQNFSFRVISIQNAGMIPNYEASTSRMFMVELDQRTARTGAKVFGLYSNLWDPEDERAPSRGPVHAALRDDDLAHDRGRLVRDPARHHRHARPRTAAQLAARPGGGGEMPFIERPDGARIHYETWGPEDGATPLLLIAPAASAPRSTSGTAATSTRRASSPTSGS